MELLISVATVDDATAALEGGADIVDAKDPAAGALGAVRLDVLRTIHAAVGGRRLLTAALGDATDEGTVEAAARAFTSAGAALVKVGLAGVASGARAEALLRAAVRGAAQGGGRVVAVAYADAARANSLAPAAIAAAAAGGGAAGLLIDTADKHGPGLSALMTLDACTALVERARDAGLLVALAGRLTAGDLPYVRAAGADIAGVRGAACEGGRGGRIVADKVRHLRALCAETSMNAWPCGQT